MHDLGVPFAVRQVALLRAVEPLWARPIEGRNLPTGAEKAAWLVELIERLWEELGHPCSEAAVAHAVACAERRRAADAPQRRVLVHGDVHQWSALRAGEGFKLVDPDGLLTEPAYDLGVLLREDPTEGAPAVRARWLAGRTGVDETAILEWGAVERVSTGLICSAVGLQPIGRQMLAVADAVASSSG